MPWAEPHVRYAPPSLSLVVYYCVLFLEAEISELIRHLERVGRYLLNADSGLISAEDADQRDMASTTTAQKVGLQYKALQGDDIRLLTIGPYQPFSHSLLNYDSRVRCLLKHYPLGQADSSSTLKTTLLARENIWSAPCRDPGIRVKDKTDISQHPLMREYAQSAASGSFGSYMRAKHFHEGRSAEDIVKGSQAQTVRGRYPWGDFFALSYTWGDPNDMREILVNDVSVQVTANLEAALRQLQKKAPIKAGVKVWIDALCLNQGDDAEKAVQVPRMRDIYGQA